MPKWRALNLIRGSMQEHCAKFNSHILALRKLDRKGISETEQDDSSAQFKRPHVGFSTLAKEYLAECRSVIQVLMVVS